MIKGTLDLKKLDKVNLIIKNPGPNFMDRLQRSSLNSYVWIKFERYTTYGNRKTDKDFKFSPIEWTPKYNSKLKHPNTDHPLYIRFITNKFDFNTYHPEEKEFIIQEVDDILGIRKANIKFRNISNKKVIKEENLEFRKGKEVIYEFKEGYECFKRSDYDPSYLYPVLSFQDIIRPYFIKQLKDLNNLLSGYFSYSNILVGDGRKISHTIDLGGVK